MTQNILLPYDKSNLTLEIDNERLNKIIRIEPQETSQKLSEKQIVLNALSNPIESQKLSELSKGKKNIVIITSDHTRAVPSSITMPLLLDEIKSTNNEAKITILIATGLHRGMTHDEMVTRFGIDIVNNYTIINHDAFDKEQNIYLGQLPSGSKFEMNKIAVDADLLIAEGFIEPHFFAGFSGGRKSILPGISSATCVNINHSAPQMAAPTSTTGVLDGNPIHEDMASAAKLSKIAFILNVLLDEEKKVKAAVAGDVEKAHRQGCNILLEENGAKAIKSDIVITTNGGSPLDQNLYQCPKGLSSALKCLNKNGVAILMASCSEGLGGDNFAKMMVSGTPEEIYKRILATPMEETIPEQWCVQYFSQALLAYKIILVSSLDKKTVEKMGFIYAENPKEALDLAYEIKGNKAKVTVIPDGVAVIIK
ncbi:MAG: nickel-dependent lactate racemase [Pleomorphochaeta sp.]